MDRIYVAAAFCILLGTFAAPASALECRWSGGGSNNQWSNRSNWTSCGGRAPQSGDSLLFERAAGSEFAGSTNDIVGLDLSGIRAVNDNSGNWFYAISGEALTLSGSVVVDTPRIDITLSILAPLTLGANVTVSALQRFARVDLATVNLNGFQLAIDNQAVLPVDDSYATRVGAITGNGSILKSGSGAAMLLQDGTYTGPTLVTAGRLILESPGAAGAVGDGNETIVMPGGVVVLDQTSTYDESFQIAGTGDDNSGALTVKLQLFSTIVTLRGHITLLRDSMIRVPQGSLCQFSVSGPISGQALTVAGHTTLHVSNPSNAWSSLIIESDAIVRLAAAGTLPDTSPLNLRGTLDLRGFSDTSGSLRGYGRILTGGATLTVNQAADDGYNGTIEGTGSLVKAGDKRLWLANDRSNSYTGTTTVNAGILRVSMSQGATALLGPVVVNGGTLETVEADEIADLSAPVTVNAPGAWWVSRHETIASLAGNGQIVFASNITGSGALDVGADNSSSTFSGTIAGSGTFP